MLFAILVTEHIFLQESQELPLKKARSLLLELSKPQMFIVDVKVVLSFIEDLQTLEIILLKLYVDQELFQEV